jgi:hypothetical protein
MQANRTGEMEAACHCGTVRFRVKLTDGFNTARRCTCSYCRMRGAVAVSADIGGITFDAGEEALTVYRFNTGVALHYFCSRCGIYTHRTLAGSLSGANRRCKKRGAESLAVTRGGPPARRFDLSQGSEAIVCF